MPDFAARSNQPELMDTESLSFQDFNLYLSHLEYINRFTFLYGPVLRWLDKEHLVKPAKPLEILEIASGGGDTARQIWRFSQKNNFNVKVIGIDINPYATKTAQIKTPGGAPLYFKTADVFSYTPPIKPEYIISIQFTHHLEDKNLITFIAWLDRTAEYGWFIYDLHRHPIPYYFIKYVLKFLPVYHFAKNDGPLSVAKAFTKADWESFLQKAGIEQSRVSIKWHFPFRYSIACRKSNIYEDK
ncbi:MAG: hypothetical protein PHX61_02760 [Alphaproteobacteria bacterium]|nr:hypothetical protein [Alphaproteobacteria bacterium]